MATHRQEKISELLCHQFGQILLSEEEFGSGVLVTVMGADISGDLRSAKIFLSVFPVRQEEAVLRHLNRRLPYFQKILKEKAALYPAPKIELAASPAGLAQNEKLWP
ncbi:MAG: ribosome-binding factor A [Candidatus Portnoybacteria bacterium]|nr:ribosome-binding factor A [Candidatus Portnoybacteria bacterium]